MVLNTSPSRTLNKDSLKKMSLSLTPSQIAKVTNIDPRIIHREMRNSKLLSDEEPSGVIRLRIKNTERGRKLAWALRLKTDVIYPNVRK